MSVESILGLALLSLVIGVGWGWAVSLLRRRGLIPDDGSVIRLPCPWERGGGACWLEWVLLNELKGTIFVLLAVSINSGWPPMLLLVFLLIVESLKYSDKVRHAVEEPLRAAGFDPRAALPPLPKTRRIAGPTGARGRPDDTPKSR